MKRPWITAINALFGVGALALLGFSVVNVARSFRGDTEMAAPAPTPAPPGAKDWADRARIIDRNLFNVSTLVPAADALEQSESYEKTRLPLRLLGTAAAGEASWAAVEDLESRKHLVARVGGPLKGATVLRIDRCRIVLQNAGRREELSLETPAGCFEGAPRAAAGAAPVAATRGRGAAVQNAVQRLAENRFAVPRAEVENAAANPAALFSQARILPRYDQGKMVGVQLNSIRPGSLFAQVGIHDGDTVTQVNGVTVATPEDSQRVLEQFAAGGALRVTVTGRDGQVRELEYVAQ